MTFWDQGPAHTSMADQQSPKIIIESQEPTSPQSKTWSAMSISNPDFFLGTDGKVAKFRLDQGQMREDFTSDLSSGVELLWKNELQGMGYNIVALIPTGNQLFFATNGFVACLDTSNGNEKWRFLVESLSHKKLHESHPEHCGGKEGFLSLTLSQDKPTLYASVNGHVIAVEATKGILKWERDFESWTCKNPAITTVIGVNNELLAGNNGIIMVLEPEHGKCTWCAKRQTGFTTIATFQSFVFMAVNESVYNFDLVSGLELSHIKVVETSTNTPTALLVDHSGETPLLFAATYEDVACLKIDEQGLLLELWTTHLKGFGSLDAHCLRVIGNHLLIGTNGKIICIDIATGNIAWSQSLPGCGWSFVEVLPLDTNLALCGSNGHLYGVGVANGCVVWQDQLKGFGHTYITLANATQWTNFNSAPLTHYIERVQTHV